jgi:hypothetical protein
MCCGEGRGGGDHFKNQNIPQKRVENRWHKINNDPVLLMWWDLIK